MAKINSGDRLWKLKSCQITAQKQAKSDNLSLILRQVEKFHIEFLCYYVDSIFCLKTSQQARGKEEKFFHFGCYEK
jgi:hypothetical protein